MAPVVGWARRFDLLNGENRSRWSIINQTELMSLDDVATMEQALRFALEATTALREAKQPRSNVVVGDMIEPPDSAKHVVGLSRFDGRNVYHDTEGNLHQVGPGHSLVCSCGWHRYVEGSLADAITVANEHEAGYVHLPMTAPEFYIWDSTDYVALPERYRLREAAETAADLHGTVTGHRTSVNFHRPGSHYFEIGEVWAEDALSRDLEIGMVQRRARNIVGFAMTYTEWAEAVSASDYDWITHTTGGPDSDPDLKRLGRSAGRVKNRLMDSAPEFWVDHLNAAQR